MFNGRIKGNRWLLVGVGFTVGLLATFVGSVLYTGEAHSSGPPAAASLPARGRPDEGLPRQVIRIRVHDGDIYPQFIRVRPGRVAIRVENERFDNVKLVVERKLPGGANERALSVSTSRPDAPGLRGKRAQGVLTLGVGEYEIYDEAQPHMRASLIVDPDDGQ